MRYRPLGKTGIEVSEIGFGAWAIGGNMWGPQDDRESLAALRRAIELGVTFIDTALIYGMGHSEEIVGRALRDVRPSRTVAIATKVPPKNMQWPAQRGCPLRDAFPGHHIEESLHRSLVSLGAERVDLLQLHVWDPAWAFEDEWFETLAKLKEQGKIRAIGISLNAHEPDTGREVVKAGRVDVLQVVYNIFEQAPEDALFPLCEERGVGLIARVPFDESSLTGKLTRDTTFERDDFRSRYFKGPRLGETVDRVAKLAGFIPRAASSLALLALRYCLSQRAISTVIPGIRNPRQAEENCSASDAGALDGSTLLALKPHRWARPTW